MSAGFKKRRLVSTTLVTPSTHGDGSLIAAKFAVGSCEEPLAASCCLFTSYAYAAKESVSVVVPDLLASK